MRRIRFSRTPVFHFEALRAVWTAAAGGGDFGEVAAVLERVRPNDFESWYRRWSEMAERVVDGARATGEPVSRGRALLRASNYVREAEFFLRPDDPRRVTAAQAQRRFFDAGTAYLGVPITRERVPYGDAHLETLLLTPPASPAQPAPRGPRTLLVVQGGFDSTLEELYFMIGAGAAERGHDVLMFTGPGQGTTLREDGVPFTPEWERPTRAVLDWVDGRVEADRTVGVGISFGGHLLARAAAFEERYDGIVLFDYFPGMLDAFVHSVPAPLRGAFTRMPAWLRASIPVYARFDAQARWAIRNALWTFGVGTLPDLVETLRAYDDHDWAGRITADALVMAGEGEHFYDPELARDFTGRLTGARSTRLRLFPAEGGGHLHCQAGALEQAHEVIFEWLERTAPAPV
ncbi:alpha/beta hydrolase [Actinomadura gamaensis]|uniref:Alpha/beta hydrolase n=1 Tax=Actinomadura gamaensis TaxID=1763541 RepID=A0ABV9TXE8_9ACTN